MSHYADQPEDKLPPNSPEAERGVLGCVMLDADGALHVLDKFYQRCNPEMFYDLRHRIIAQALVAMKEAGKRPDMLMLGQFLKDTANLDRCGGLLYLSEIPDSTPSAANFDYYLEILREKWILRRLIQLCQDDAARLEKAEGGLEGVLAAHSEAVSQLQIACHDPDKKPERIKEPMDFEQGYFDCWFNRTLDTFGMELPWPFPLRIRPSEFTLITGDSGGGKTSLICEVLICLARQGALATVASMEIPPAVTLWMMARQCLGEKKLPNNPEGHDRAYRALHFLQKHVRLYDFLGITDWRELLETFRYSREHYQSDVFVVDSAMRLGIADDDYSTQGFAAAQFSEFCVKTGAHLFLVNHVNKGDGKTKNRIRGSKQWSDSANNILEVVRNEEKTNKIDDLDEQVRTKKLEQASRDEQVSKMRGLWDSKLILCKQRWPGARQNGSKYLWFDHDSLQFRDKPDALTVCYLPK